MVKEIQGKFNLNKQLTDKRQSPRTFLFPEEEDILVHDHHTDDDGIIHYGKVVGIVKNIRQDTGKVEYDWIPTDPALINMIDNAKHPEKLFKYSPEFVPLQKSDDYPEGEVGKLKSIAIANDYLANDQDAITTKIKNTVNKIFKGDDEMKDTEVNQMIEDKLKPFEERLKLLDKVEETMGKLDKVDFEKLGEVAGMVDNIQKIPDIEKNIKQIVDGDPEEKTNLIKFVKENSGLEEETLSKMSVKELEVLKVKFTKEEPGVSGQGGQPDMTIVEQINAEYNTHVGETLNK